nr:zf-HC2 domain-containing protein [Cellulosimicrobium arenosum]
MGSRLSALVDGQLTPADTERALEHVARCPACEAGLAAARDARRALSDALHVEPAPDLTERLLALSAQIPPVDDDPLRGPERRDDGGWTAPDRELPRGCWSGDLRPQGARRRVVAVALGGAGTLAIALFALGQPPVVTPSLHRAEPLSVLAHAVPAAASATAGATTSAGGTSARTTGGADVLEAMRRDGWSTPDELPAGTAVAAVRVVDGRLELDLATPSGEVVVREQTGRLDTAALAAAETWDVQDRTVHVLSQDPWHVVWQSGDTVVDVVGDGEEQDVAGLVATFPTHDYDAGVPARISRGWTTMTGALGTS